MSRGNCPGGKCPGGEVSRGKCPFPQTLRGANALTMDEPVHRATA